MCVCIRMGMCTHINQDYCGCMVGVAEPYACGVWVYLFSVEERCC